MGKLFLKLWILILLTSVTSFKIQQTVFDLVYAEAMESNSNERYRRVFIYIEEILRQHPQAEWPDRFRTLQEHVGSPKVFVGPSRLTTLEALASESGINAEALARIRSQQPLVRSMAGGEGTEIFHTLLGTDYVAVLEVPALWRSRMFGLLTTTQFTWIVESTLYALAVMLWLMFFWWDMKKLDRAAGQVGEGKFNIQVDIRKGAALYPLASSFNKMKDRIAALLDSHKNLTNAVSHEFRTPITRLRFRHELAIHAGTLAEKDHELQLMNSAIDQLDDLSTELLEYARLDRDEPKLDIGSIDVEPWLNELAADAREVASATGREVQISVHADCEAVDGDHRYLSRAAANLLQNAVRYAKKRVELRAGTANGKRWLRVDDDGAGIPPADRERLFEPFTRLDDSRDRQSGGSGIGLAIVRQIARWHGGTAQIAESSLGGASVSLTW
ncbi:MAG: ATP-binding protein [Betaproteobacteria bacterium]